MIGLSGSTWCNALTIYAIRDPEPHSAPTASTEENTNNIDTVIDWTDVNLAPEINAAIKYAETIDK
jgi:hypothetical protein